MASHFVALSPITPKPSTSTACRPQSPSSTLRTAASEGCFGYFAERAAYTSIKELTPYKQETTLASRNRSEDMPLWSQEFTENLANQKQQLLAVLAHIFQNQLGLDPPPAKAPKRKHNLFTHFPTDPNGGIC